MPEAVDLTGSRRVTDDELGSLSKLDHLTSLNLRAIVDQRRGTEHIASLRHIR